MTGQSKSAIWADAMRLAAEMEMVVRGFSRYHKYTLGAHLRRHSAQICRYVARAMRFPEQL